MKSKPPVLRGLYSRLKYEFRAIKELYVMCKLAQRRKEWLCDVHSGKIYVGMNNGDQK